MKVKAIIVVIAASVIGYFGFSFNEHKEEVVQNEDVSVVGIEDKNTPQPSTSGSDVEKVKTQPTNENIIASKSVEAGDESVQKAVQEAIDVNLDDEDKYYDFIIENFPELTTQVNAYRHDIKEQRLKVSAFSDHMKERNEQVKNSKNIDAGADKALQVQQQILLQEARRLGKQAMALNQAIREAAYNK